MQFSKSWTLCVNAYNNVTWQLFSALVLIFYSNFWKWFFFNLLFWPSFVALMALFSELFPAIPHTEPSVDDHSLVAVGGNAYSLKSWLVNPCLNLWVVLGSPQHVYQAEVAKSSVSRLPGASQLEFSVPDPWHPCLSWMEFKKTLIFP